MEAIAHECGGETRIAIDVCRDEVGEQPGYDREKARGAVADILELSKGVTLGDLQIEDLIEEGHP